MSTLNKTLEILEKVHLVEGYEDFSINYANRNSGWLSYQLHKDRDFSVLAAISTLRSVRRVKTFYFGKKQRLGALADEYIDALEQADALLQTHLEEQYGIIQIKQ